MIRGHSKEKAYAMAKQHILNKKMSRDYRHDMILSNHLLRQKKIVYKEIRTTCSYLVS